MSSSGNSGFSQTHKVGNIGIIANFVFSFIINLDENSNFTGQTTLHAHSLLTSKSVDICYILLFSLFTPYNVSKYKT